MSRTYEQLEPVISALDERIKTNLGAFPTDTAEGSIVSFPDGADDIPLKSLVVNIDPVQSGSGDPSPDNVRPISGWTGANVTRCGKNLFDKSDVEFGYFKADGSITYGGGTKYVSGYIKISPNTSYYFTNVIPANDGRSGFWYDANKNPIEVVLVSPSTLTSFAVTSPSNAEYVRIGCYVASVESCQLEVGSTATDYEPYSASTYDITFPSEAGTVYGGTLDVTNGELVVDRAMINLGTWNWTMTSISQGNLFRTPIIVNSALQYDGLNIVCSNYPTVKASQRQDKTMSIGSDNRVDIIDSNYSDASAFKTAMNGVQLVYELATPITYQLTPQEITSLLGQNNIFADTGDTEVEYRADTKLYIERLTEPDADMIADANIVSGSYFMVGNTLYKATANIASGSAVIEGTNATRKSLSEALNEINQ